MKPPECIPPLLRAGIDPADAHALRRAVDPATTPRTYADLMVFAMRYRNLRGEHLRAVRKMTGRRNSTFALGQTRVGLGAVTII